MALLVDYVKTTSENLLSMYPCDGLDTTSIRIIYCVDNDKKYVEFIDTTDDGVTESLRILLNGLEIFDTLEDLRDYKYRSVNKLYFVEANNVLYYYKGCLDDDELVIDETEGYIYVSGNTSNVAYMYFTSISELSSAIGTFRSMVPVFLKNKIKKTSTDDDGNEITTIDTETIAPYTLGNYVFLSTGETVEEICSQITRFHRIIETVIVSEDTSIVEIPLPFSSFFDNASYEDDGVTVETNYMDVYIGSVWVAPERYEIVKETDSNDNTTYYVEFNKDDDDEYEFVIKSGRTVYFHFYYNTYPATSSATLTLLDGSEIVRHSITTDKLASVSDDTNSVDENAIASSFAIKKLRNELIDQIQINNGYNVLHANSASTDESNVFKTDISSDSGCVLYKKTGSTLYLTLHADLPSDAYVNVVGVASDADGGDEWSDNGSPISIPIYLPDDSVYTYTDNTETDLTVPMNRFKEGQTVQLVYNDIKDSPRFYVNTGEKYRLVKTYGTFTYTPSIVSSTVEDVELDIYITDTTQDNHISPAIDYLAGIDTINVYKDGVILLEGTGYTYHESERYITVNLTNIESATYTVEVSSIRNIY